MAVLAPKPNLRRYSSTFAAPMRWASWMVPMFDDTVRMPATVSWLGSCSASPKVAPPSSRCCGDGEHRGRVRHALLEGRRHGDHLVHRAGLEHGGDRGVVRRGVHLAGLGIVDHVGHRQDLTGGRVADDHDAALRPGLLHLGGEQPLGLVLQVAVERQHHVGAGLRAASPCAGRRRSGPGSSPRSSACPGVPSSCGLYWFSRPEMPVAVDVGGAEQRAGQVAGGVEALVLGREGDAVELAGRRQRLDLRGHRVGHEAGEVHEAAPGGAELLLEVGRLGAVTEDQQRARAASAAGSDTALGSATTVDCGTDTARSWPLRSSIEPA